MSETFDFTQAVEAVASGVMVHRTSHKNHIMFPEQDQFHFTLDDYYAKDWAVHTVEPEAVGEQ